MAEPVHESTQAPAHSGPQGGLPQFDPVWWPGQAIWFLIVFAVVFALMAKVFVPRVGGAIAEREDRISGDISRARALKEQAEAQATAAEAEIAQARASAQRVAAEAKARVQAEAAARQSVEDAKLAETMSQAEASIAAAREQAMTQIGTIAADAAATVLAQRLARQGSDPLVDKAVAELATRWR